MQETKGGGMPKEKGPGQGPSCGFDNARIPIRNQSTAGMRIGAL